MKTPCFMQMSVLKASIKEAEKEVDIAERYLKDKQLHLQTLRNQLQNEVIDGIKKLKVEDNITIKQTEPREPENEAQRKARVKRKVMKYRNEVKA